MIHSGAVTAPIATGELAARLYALIHRGTDGDVAFYQDECEGAARVLELGCGSGRVLSALVDVADDVWGVDLDPNQLAFARVTAPGATFVQGNMKDVVLDGMFDRIVIPYCGLWTLPTDEEIAECLQHIARHLNPHGVLLFDVYAIDDAEVGNLMYEDEDEEELGDYSMGELSATVTERTAPIPDEERSLRAEYIYRMSDGRQWRQVVNQHFVTPDSLVEMCAAAGLEVVQRCGDFYGSPYHRHAEHLVVRAMHATEAP